METKRVLIVMGSRSDLPSMDGCMKQLDDFQVGYEVRVLSAHRTPEAEKTFNNLVNTKLSGNCNKSDRIRVLFFSLR